MRIHSHSHREDNTTDGIFRVGTEKKILEFASKKELNKQRKTKNVSQWWRLYIVNM